MRSAVYEKVNPYQNASNCPYYESAVSKTGCLITWDEQIGLGQTCSDCFYYKNGRCHKKFK